MRKLRRLRPSPAMVVASIALFVALGGVGYAAATVGTDDIQTGAVTSPKIHNAAVNTQKLAAGAVGNGKIADFAVTSGKLGSDSVTAPKLADTADGVTSQSVPATTTLSVTATCPAGDQAISGGYSTPDTGVVQVTGMRRNTDNSWVITFRNSAATAQAVDARVTCLIG